MRGLGTMTLIELKLFLREPAAVFFTLAFPLMLLFIFGSIFGNDPNPQLGGRGSVDVSVPGYSALIIGTTSLIGLPITLAAYREQGVLRRLRATPVRPFVVLGSHVLVSLASTALGISLLVVAGRLVYNLVWPEAPLAVAFALVLSTLSFCGLGFVIGGLLPTARSAQAIGSAFFFPQLFLSGASVPREIMPERVRTIADALPLTQVVILVSGLWSEGGWDLTALAALSGLFAISVLVSIQTFRWE